MPALNLENGTEMAYCPRVAKNYDVLNKAADFAIRKLEKCN